MVTIIFGAGASYGSGENTCVPYNPPLGKDLFAHLVRMGGEFSRLSEESKLIFQTQGFEAGMATIEDDSRAINPLQKELACYLSGFEIRPGNGYIRLFNKLHNVLKDICIVTLNYDLLIEQALGLQGFNIDYNDDKKGITVLKPHGSSNFLPRFPKGMTITGSMTAINCKQFIA